MENYDMCNYDEDQSKGEIPEESFTVNCYGNGDVGYPCHTDDGPYFDLNFTLPIYCDDTFQGSKSCIEGGDDDEEFEFNFSISTANPSNPLQCISPADNLFYKGQLLPLHLPPRLDMVRTLDVEKNISSLQSFHAQGEKTHFPKLLKSATKLKVSLFGFRKSSKVGMDMQAPCLGSGTDSPVQKQSGFFTVKFKVVEVPFVSLFTRDNSRGSKRSEDSINKSDDSDEPTSGKNLDRDKKGAKEIVQKYVKMIKPLYVKISQRYGNEKSRFTEQSSMEKSGVENPIKNSPSSGSGRSQSHIPFSGNLRMAYRHLGKGRCPPSKMPSSANHSCDSTMLELQNAIQGAIAHCKQSNHTNDAQNSQDSECSS